MCRHCFISMSLNFYALSAIITTIITHFPVVLKNLTSQQKIGASKDYHLKEREKVPPGEILAEKKWKS